MKRIENLNKKNGFELSWLTTVDGDEYRTLEENASQEIQKQLNVPGFRKGKAPMEAVRAAVGEGPFYRVITETGINGIYEHTVQENGFEPVGEPQFNIADINRDHIVFLTKVDVYPDYTLNKYIGLEAVRPDDSVTEEEIDGQIERFRRNHMVVLDTGRAAQDDDIVWFSYAISYDGPEFIGSACKDVMQHLDQPSQIPGLAEALQGKKPGDIFTYEADAPKNDPRAIAGKHISVHVRVQQVKQRFLPDLTDELVKRYISDCSTVAEYREKIRSMNHKERAEEADKVFETNLDEALAAQVDVHIPPEMINLQLQMQYARMNSALTMQNQTIDGYLEEHHLTKKELREISTPQALREIKVMLALDRVAELEGITEEDDTKRAKKARKIVRDNAVAVTEGKAE